MPVVVVTVFIVISSFFGGLYLTNTRIEEIIPKLLNESPSPTTSTVQNKIGLDKTILWSLIQSYRVENNWPVFERKEELCAYAEKRLEELKSDWKTNLNYRTELSDYEVGENDSKDNTSESWVVNTWSRSKDTVDNLSNNFKYACLVTEKSYAVLIVASPKEKVATKTPTNLPKVPAPVTAPKIETDPIVSCLISSQCGGGQIELRQSVCNKSVCCQVGEKWYFYQDNNKCTTDQNAYNAKVNSVYNSAPLITCTVSYPCTGAVYTYQLDFSSCMNAQSEAARICSNSYSNSSSTTYSKPSQQNTGSSTQMTKSQCYSAVNDKYRGQMSAQGCAYPCPDTGDCGDSSVCDALWSYAKREMSACNQYP